VSVEVHYELDGPEAAPVLLLSNSLGTALDMWDDQMPALAEHFRVVRYDQRGHGRSPAPPGPYSIEELAGDALALLDRFELERVSFCGASMGGMTGVWLAINAPERVDRLGLCCTSAHIPPRERWLERAAMVRGRKGMESVVDASLERWFTPAFRGRQPETVERLERGLREIDPEGYAGCCEALAEADLRAQLATIRAPTLVITGEDDLSTPPDHGRLIAEQVENGRCLMLSPARHLANVEQSEEVTRALLDHLIAAEVT
jgi:3-oxoadipate enol-lactonase